MRTTVNLDDDVTAAVEALRRERSIGLSAAVNELARAGLRGKPTGTAPFVQETEGLGMRIDVANVADVLELLDDEPADPR